MGVGPNYVLDKGHKATGATAYRRGELVKPVNAGLDVARVTALSALDVYYVCMEDLDATRVSTGKAFIDCRILGIARVISGVSSIPVWSRIVPNTSALGVVATKTAAGSAPAVIAGIALTPVTVLGQEFDMLLTPGATW